MARKFEQGARNARMPDALPVRRRVTSLDIGSNAISGVTAEVPHYLLGAPKGKGRKRHLNARRDQMRASMDMRSGYTSVGCIPGTRGFISIALNEMENALLKSMGEVIGPVEAVHQEVMGLGEAVPGIN